jgi:Fe-S-cluster containining protein
VGEASGDRVGRPERVTGGRKGVDPSVCAQCAETSKSCCQAPPGEKLATLTFADIARIESASGVPARRFVEIEVLDPAVRIYYETSRPLYAGMLVGGVRHGLKAEAGACVFLDPTRGCTLPRAARPRACVLYPIDLGPAGEPTLVEAPHCLALERAQSWPLLLRMLGLSRRRLRKLFRQMRQECAEHAAALRRQQRTP